METAGGDQALDDADMFGTQFGPAKHPVLATHRNDAQGAFEVVGVDWHVGVGEKYFQSRPSLAGIGQRFGERIGRQQALALELPDVRRLKSLEEENARLKRMYADLALETHALKD